MKIERKELGALTEELTLIIEKQDYLPEYEEQLKSYQQKAQLKGFRKGKTPMGLIKKMYGTATMQESVSKILGQKLNELITGEEINIIGEPLFLEDSEVPEIDHSSPTDYTYKFEIGIEPEFEVQGAGEADSYTKRTMIISDEMIDEEMNIGLQRLGEQKETDAKIKEDDVIYLEIKEKQDGEIKEDGHSSEFSVAWNSMTEAYQKEFKGLAKGDQLEVNVYELEKDMDRDSAVKYFLKINTEDEAAEIPGSEIFNAEITKVVRTEQAEMNQDFFDKYFGKDQVKSEEEAREKIKGFLSEHFNKESVNLLNREIMHNLVDSNAFELPSDFLKKWISREQEVTDEQFESFIQELKWRTIKRKLTKSHDIKVEEKEILDHFVQMIRNYSPYIDEATLKNTVFSLMKNREQVNQAVEAVSSGKLFDVLRDIVKIEEKEVSKDDFMAKVKEINEMAN